MFQNKSLLGDHEYILGVIFKFNQIFLNIKIQVSRLNESLVCLVCLLSELALASHESATLSSESNDLKKSFKMNKMEKQS